MMDFFLGMACGMAFFGVMLLSFELGRKQKKQPRQEPSEEQKRVREKLRKEYNEIMNYDADKARGSG